MACYGFLSADTIQDMVPGKRTGEVKALAALKNHSEAERRRRQRINSHLTTLRGLVPCNDKMDKATLLAEVIKQVKEAKKRAAEVSNGVLIPTDYDSVVVDTNLSSSFSITLCCAYRPELLSDIRQTIEALPIKIVRTQVSTLEDRLNLSFEFTANQNVNGAPILVRDALSSVLDKASSLAEYSPRSSLPSKRRRLNLI